MFEFIETAEAIRVLYNHVNDILTEEDFWQLTPEQCAKLCAGQQSQEWFMINPAKLKKTIPEGWVVDQDEKMALLRAVNFVQKTTDEELSESSSFLEKLLYIKQILPPVFYSKEA